MLRTAVTTIRSRAARWGAVGFLLPVVILSQACEPVPDVASPTTTTTATTTPAAPSTTTTAIPTTTTAAPNTTTTIPGDPGTPGALTLTDTELTRVRVTITSQAVWADVDLVGTQIDVSRVVSTTGEMRVTSLGPTISVWGQGSATIDLVLRVPPGASTALTMCKNYLGPASVTVRRLTVGDVLVSSLDNLGTSTAVPPGSCENAASASMTRADLIGPARWPARRDPRPLVLANYYPWYDPVRLSTIGPDRPTGPADSSDPEQVQAAVDLARSSGVDGFVVEYEASTAHEPMIDHVFAAADARPGFQMALMLDFANLQVRPGGLTDAGLDSALNEVASHAGRPSQLEVGGQPVVFLYEAFRVDPAAWSAAMERLRGRTGLQPFVVADGPSLSSPGRFDYGPNNFSDRDELRDWALGRLRSLQEEPGLLGADGPLWVAPVSPGYDDQALGRLQPMYVPRNGGARYQETWDAALTSLPDWIFVNTWNEYYENTHVMPGSITGTLALTQTDARSARFHASG